MNTAGRSGGSCPKPTQSSNTLYCIVTSEGTQETSIVITPGKSNEPSSDCEFAGETTVMLPGMPDTWLSDEVTVTRNTDPSPHPFLRTCVVRILYTALASGATIAVDVEDEVDVSDATAPGVVSSDTAPLPTGVHAASAIVTTTAVTTAFRRAIAAKGSGERGR